MSLQQHLLDTLMEPRLLQQELPHTVGLAQQQLQLVLWVDWDSRRKDLAYQLEETKLRSKHAKLPRRSSKHNERMVRSGRWKLLLL
jgi:hypothetical protein